MIKDIIVSLSVGTKSDTAADFAISVADAFDAHLTGIAVAYEPIIPGMVFDGASAAIVADARAENEKVAEAARADFEAKAKRAGRAVESRVVTASTVGSADTFARMARCFDLSVVAQAQPDNELPELTIEAALFDSGRPVLVVPYIQKTGLKLDRVMVCWDGSRNAARAIADAMPLLQKAGTVDVVTVSGKEQPQELVGTEIAQHLARHGLNVTLKPIVSPDSDVGNVLLSYTSDASIDLIVMGGYGHSRLREFILGGATRGILSAMTVPTLMSH